MNVDGTGNVLDLLADCKLLQRHNYVSTAYVAGDRTGHVYEHELLMGQGFKNHYESTKFQAEVWVRHSMDRIPTTIYRPAIVVGDSQTGETQKFDGPYYILRTAQRAMRMKSPIPQFGKAAAPFNVVPVDFVVDALFAGSLSPDAVGETLHLVDPEPITASELASMLAREYAGQGAGLQAPAEGGRAEPAQQDRSQGVPRRPARVDRLPEPPGALRHAPRVRPDGRAATCAARASRSTSARWSRSSGSTRTTRPSSRPRSRAA